MTKTEKAIKAARERLLNHIDSACRARGEAMWTNGYRTARMACGAESEEEDDRLYNKEINQSRYCGEAEKRVERALAAYARVIRRSFDPMRRRAVKR